MIRELIRSWRTPASKAARKLGYLYESIAMEERYRRRRRSWQSHISKCIEVTLREIRASGVSGELLILGSGPLNEIPLTELTGLFRKIHLADMIHPLEVRRKWGRHPKIELHDIDLSGVAESMLKYVGGPLPSPKPPALPRVDFILSANCLSQLPLKPRQHAQKWAEPSDLDEFCERISAAHLEQIKTSRLPHLIIADFETEIISESGEVLERSRPFFEKNTLSQIESWSWSVAPKGEFHRQNSVQMSVGAFKISD